MQPVQVILLLTLTNWIISIEEINQCENPEFMWVKDLPLIEFKPKPQPQPRLEDL